jgi:pheromone shutdown protein TraB
MLNPIQGSGMPTVWGLSEVRKRGIFQFLLHNYIAQAAVKLDISPGEEYRVAAAEAMKHDAKIMLGDRPSQVTLQRAWFSLTHYERLKLISRFVCSVYMLPGTEELTKLVAGVKNTDLMTAAVREVSKEFPSLTTTLIDERDLYMVHTLRRSASFGQKVVAVVGAGHIPGIQKKWHDLEIDIDPLLWPMLPPTVGWVEALFMGASLSLAMCTAGWAGAVLLARRR